MSIVGRVPLAESPGEQTSVIKRIVVSSILGTAVEWYDFLIYGTASALVFNKLFFPLSNPTLGTIAAFGTYGVGFLARPLGAAIFGHFGDRVGRKAMLAMTIVIMGLGTFLVGLLPTYSQIGILAPVLLVLLRLLQGIGLGGEWAGAVLMVVENAPARSRGLLGSMVQLGYPIGNLAAIGALALLSRLPEADFLAWGWRIPFLISILLAGVGLYIRMQLEETPVFREIEAKKATASKSSMRARARARHGVLLKVTNGQIECRAARAERAATAAQGEATRGATTRAGGTCQVRAEPGNARCRFHGGLSTGPKTVAGRARVAEAQRRRWRQYRERRKLVANRLSDPIHPGAADP